MRNKLLKLIISKKSKEQGMASLLYVFMFLLIVAVMGLGFDAALGNYTANSLKDAVNSAALSASSETKFQGNKRVIVKDKAYNKFLSLYSTYRQSYPNVTAKGNPQITFKVTKSRGSTVPNTLTVNVKEKSKTHFIALVGVTEQKYNLTATARLGSLYEIGK